MTGVTPVCTENGVCRAARIVGGGCLAAAVAVAIAACGTVPAPGQGAGRSGHGGAATLSAARAVALAGQSARRVRSLVVTDTMVIHGLPAGSVGAGLPGAGGGVGLPGSHGTTVFTVLLKMQLKPVLRMEVSTRAGGLGRGFAFREILVPGAVYISAPGMRTAPGKPWHEVKLSDLPSGLRPAEFLKKVEGNDPLAGLTEPAAEARLLAAARHLRVVHGQVVNGVATTEYAGTLPVSRFLSMMAGANWKPFSAAPGTLRRADLPFRIWIDARHQVRRLTVTMALGSVSTRVTINVIAINRPVTITTPPAGEVATAPVP